MADVDAVLAQIRSLLGSGQPPTWPQRSFGSAVAPVSSWRGSASDRGHAVSDTLNVRRTALSDAYASIGPLVMQAAQITSGARARLDAIQAQWQADKANFAPIANTSAGKMALLTMGQLRINDATAVVHHAQAAFAQLAATVQVATSRLPQAPGGADLSALTWKTSPIPDPGGPDNPVGNGRERHPKYKDHRLDGTWAPGNSGVDGDEAMNYTFDRMEEDGIELVRQQVAVYVVDPKTGTRLPRRTYDALMPTGVPGQYVGIEHKVNESAYTTHQQKVDGLVRSGVPARGVLNGKPIEVVDVELIRIEWPLPDAGPTPEPNRTSPSAVPAPTIGAPPVTSPVSPGAVEPGTPRTLPDWGTPISPDVLRDTDGELGILQDFIDAFRPSGSGPPPGTAHG